MGDMSRWGEVAIGRSLLQKRGWFPSNKSRDREIAPTAIRDGDYVAIGRSLLQFKCTHFRNPALIRNKLTFCGNCCILLKYLVGGHC